MAHQVIEGTIQLATLKRESRRCAQFQEVTLLRLDGLEIKLRNLSVPASLASAISPGTSGRFYLHGRDNRPSVHGIRTHDGRTGFGFLRGGGEWLMLCAAALAIVAAAAAVIVHSAWCIGIALNLGIITVIAALLLRRARSAANLEFLNDRGDPATS